MVGYDGSREWRGERRLVNVGASVRACRLILKVELLTSHCCQESNCPSRLSGMPHALSRPQKCILKRSFTHAVIKVKTYVLILFLYSFFRELNRCREFLFSVPVHLAERCPWAQARVVEKNIDQTKENDIIARVPVSVVTATATHIRIYYFNHHASILKPDRWIDK